jgi:hypothetical protein
VVELENILAELGVSCADNRGTKIFPRLKTEVEPEIAHQMKIFSAIDSQLGDLDKFLPSSDSIIRSTFGPFSAIVQQTFRDPSLYWDRVEYMNQDVQRDKFVRLFDSAGVTKELLLAPTGITNSVVFGLYKLNLAETPGYLSEFLTSEVMPDIDVKIDVQIVDLLFPTGMLRLPISIESMNSSLPSTFHLAVFQVMNPSEFSKNIVEFTADAQASTSAECLRTGVWNHFFFPSLDQRIVYSLWELKGGAQENFLHELIKNQLLSLEIGSVQWFSLRRDRSLGLPASVFEVVA